MTYQQHGIHCPLCDEDIYSNSRHDFVECRGGCVYIDGGWDYTRVGGVGLAEHTPISRMVDRKTLPFRYREEVPDR